MKKMFTAIASAAFLCCAFLIARMDNPLTKPEYLVTLLMIMFGTYLLLSHSLLKGGSGRGVNQPPSTLSFQRRQLYVILGLSLAAQLIFLFMPAFFNDFWRYLWDGWMSINHVNPYQFFPWAIHDTPITAHLASVPYWDDMFFKWTHTIYGPTLQAIFALSNGIAHHSALALKAIFFMANLGSLWIGIALLDHFKKDRRFIALLALHPLFLFETLGTAHTEAIIIFLLLLTVLLFVKKKYALTGISFGALILTKFFPLLIAPLFLLSMNHRRQYSHVAILAISIIATCTILYLPFVLTISDTSLLFESFKDFSNEWIMSPGIFDLVHTGVARSGFAEPFLLTKRVLTATTFTGVLFIYALYWRSQKRNPNSSIRNREFSIFDATWWIFLLLIIFSSVIFSWYILWLLALLPFIKHKWPTIILSITFATQYLLIYFDGAEHNTFKYRMDGDILWHQLLVWLPFFIALAWSLYTQRKRRQAIAFYARIPNKYLLGKTRIGKVIRDQHAANALARALILDMLDAYAPARADYYDLIFYFKGSRGDFDDSRVTQWIEQQDDTLPNNMKHIHDYLASQYRRFLIVGSDIPLLSRKVIKKSFASLRHHDVVIAPVADGGYGLIGARRSVDLYTSISNWESRSPGYDLCKKTMGLLEQLQLTFFALPLTFDIDTPKDVRELWAMITLNEQLKSEYSYLSRTYAWLKTNQHRWE